MEMNIYLIISLLILTGFLATTLGGIIGIGGGIIMMPIMTIFLGIDPLPATLYSLSAIFIMSIISNYRYFKSSKPNYRAWFFIVLLAIPGEIVGTMKIAPIFQDSKLALHIVFLLLMVVVTILMFFRSRLKFKCPLFLSALLGLFVGLASGSLGIGGGILLVPGLLIFFNFKSKKAASTAMFVKFFTALTGALVLLSSSATGHIDFDYKWYYIVAIASGAVMGSFIGSWIHIKAKHNHITIILWITIILLTLQQLIEVIRMTTS